eukprot:scaffold18897_cov53-Phaeocystis_antarctica.AAC.4
MATLWRGHHSGYSMRCLGLLLKSSHRLRLSVPRKRSRPARPAFAVEPGWRSSTSRAARGAGRAAVFRFSLVGTRDDIPRILLLSMPDPEQHRTHFQNIRTRGTASMCMRYPRKGAQLPTPPPVPPLMYTPPHVHVHDCDMCARSVGPRAGDRRAGAEQGGRDFGCSVAGSRGVQSCRQTDRQFGRNSKDTQPAARRRARRPHDSRGSPQAAPR